MLDFLRISEDKRLDKKTGIFTVYVKPEYIVRRSKDLMIRGEDFYAVWDEKNGVWSTNEDDALDIIDEEVMAYANEYKKQHPDATVIPKLSKFSSSGVINEWHKYVTKDMRNNFHNLNETIIFSNYKPKRSDYASIRVDYPLEEGSIEAYEELISTLYSPEERHKLEWAIGAIITGDSKKIQKFIVLYGSAGTGKSTILNIIQDLFTGYYTVFDAQSIGSSSKDFALAPFINNPLVGIQHDGDLSKIEDNTRLNSLVSHEEQPLNQKYEKVRKAKINTFLFMGTNKPVKITDAKSGIIRRLIDVNPTGNKILNKRYLDLTSQVKFELGAIAYHCKQVYLEDPGYYDAYIPITMIGATNDFYNYMEENYFDYKKAEYVTLTEAWKRYSEYCNEAKVYKHLSKTIFKEELKNYFDEYYERYRNSDGNQMWNVYSKLKLSKFEMETPKKVVQASSGWLQFNSTNSLLDILGADYPAQLANEDGIPLSKWQNCTTTLKDISTKDLHFVKVPENHIVIDFDIKNDKGEKDFELNLKAASKWQKTYAELSKSGAGIHLHYIYKGDVAKLSRVYDDDVEVKVFTGNSSLRRKLTRCNDISIASLNSGLPLKGESKMVNWDGIKSEKQIRTMIKKNLNKEYHDATKPSIDYIKKILDDAYASELKYDVSDMKQAVLYFAMDSTHQSNYCIKAVGEMKFKSEEVSESNDISKEAPIVFFDVEVFPNLFLVNWKFEDEEKCHRMINPTPMEIESLFNYRLIGFNNLRYDNIILYARSMGYSNEDLFALSQQIVSGASRGFYEAKNVSYTDIYDYCSEKKSLKKWEFELASEWRKEHKEGKCPYGHKELGLPWDKPVPKERWEEVAEYCDNDVFATEALHKYRESDFTARKILAEIAGGTVNDTTNTLTTRLIFGSNKEPQSSFCYRDLAQPVYEDDISMNQEKYDFLSKKFPEMLETQHGDCSVLPYFSGYSYVMGKSTYKGYEVGEGGFVWAKPGMYGRTITFDVASMHPHSVLSEYLFGKYTKEFNDLVQSRIYIKHKNFDEAKKLFGGKLSRYLDDPSQAKQLSGALKIAINSVYGLTAAKFKNPFRDPRNVDNIVAKRGALFMINLMEAVKERGGEVVHIKTDSIKVVNPSQEIQDFIFEYGKHYGYTFEVEHIFEKFCLVNDAVYVGKCAADDPEAPGEWTATGAQFAVPYVFKTLFSREKIEFDDMCETKSVSSSLYLDMNEKLVDEHNYVFVGKVGQFCPIKEGCGGGLLMREKDGKYSAATGSKGYRWLEAETVRELGKLNDIDKSYYTKLVDDAIATIAQYGDVEWFTNC